MGYYFRKYNGLKKRRAKNLKPQSDKRRFRSSPVRRVTGKWITFLLTLSVIIYSLDVGPKYYSGIGDSLIPERILMICLIINILLYALMSIFFYMRFTMSTYTIVVHKVTLYIFPRLIE